MNLPMLCAALAAFTALATSAGEAWSQAWPNRPIRIIVPTAAGGGPDVVARFIAPRLTEVLGQPIVIENRAGANAMLGAEVVARAPADGYTWLMGTGQNTVNPSVMKHVPHDIVADFAPVSLVYQSAYVLTVHPNVPARNVKEVVALARAKPDRLNFGSGGTGSAAHLSGELFMQMTGTRMMHIPYKGVALALADLVGGQVDLVFPAIASGQPYVKAGRLRALGVTSPKRHPSLPEVPTIAETVPTFESRSWIGVLMPAGVPRAIVDRANAAIVKVVNSTEVRQSLVAQGADPETGTPEALHALIREEVARAARVVKAAGIRPE